MSDQHRHILDGDTVYASVTELAAAIRERRVSAAEMLDAYLTQIERHNPTLNAVVTMDIDAACDAARRADDALAHDKPTGPLHGVPFTLKDAHATAGMRTTTGFPSFANEVPEHDGTVAARLKGAGGVLMGKTNVPSMLADFQTDNPIFGRTNNPWDIERTPGGSSGGAAAAVAAGLTPFEVGTDLSASIRIPAHFCGVYGLKTTEHRIPLTGLIPGLPGPTGVRIMSTIGPIARSVDDLALLLGILAGPDGRDTDVPAVPVAPIPDVALHNLRVAVAPTFPDLPVAADIRAAITHLASELEAQGTTIAEALPQEIDFGDDLRQAGALIGMITGVFDPDQNDPQTTMAAYLEALDRRDRSINAWERFFDRWDVLLCPASMTMAIHHCPPGTPVSVDGQETDYFMLSAHGTLFNYSGHPALTLPLTTDHEGLPIGVQLVGARWSEPRLLGIGRAIEALTGGFQRPPGYSNRA